MSDTQSHSAAFVRETPLAPMAPPGKEQGIVKWMRENLFATWPNAILTVVAAYVIYLILAGAMPWIFNGVWNTGSLAECREALNGAVGGCFSVLTERWNQLLFGFKYPPELYWRPLMAFILLFVAMAPVLFFDLPRKMLIFTGLYPFVAFWLVWGGTIWTPILVAAGMIAAYAVFDMLQKKSFGLAVLAGFAVIAVAFLNPIGWVLSLIGAIASLFVVGSVNVDLTLFTTATGPIALSNLLPLLTHFSAGLHAIIPVSLDAIPSRDMGGYMLNMMLGVTCVSLSVPIGIALALGRQSSMPLIKWICVIFIEFIRGVPLITLLFVANVMLAYFFPPGSGVDLFLRVVIMITMFSAAYIAEVIRGGLAALPKGQYEAADSLGLDYAQAMRLIILPQALKISIPGIVNIAVGLFKDTTLVSVISMFDIVGMIRGPILASTDWGGVYWELYGFACVVFFVVCYGISQYSQWLERRLATDHR